ncbi:MAG: hypothetical protein CMN84_00755 [Spongiibacteraceae bacterium]|nr:hypothetical protein [Spongiibacteraceae bacterium]
MSHRKLFIISAIACLCSVVIAGFLAFQLNSDGYYLGWSSGIMEACKDGCPALKREDLGLAKSLAAEGGEFRESVQSKWFAFIAVIGFAIVSSLAGLVVAIRDQGSRTRNA